MHIIVLTELVLFAITWLCLFHTGLSLRLAQILLPKGRLTSVYPPKLSTSVSDRMSPLLYIPSRLSLRPSNMDISVRNDEHFLSVLADHGHTVHCLHLFNDISSISQVQSCIADSLVHIAPRQEKIILVANDLSCLNALQFVSNPSASGRLDRQLIHGVVLIDPPPLYSVQTEHGRRQILRKYASLASDYFTSVTYDAIDSDPDTLSTPALPTSDLVIHTTEGDVDIQALALKTQEEVDYFERKLQSELYKRPAVSVRINKHKAFHRRQLNRSPPKVDANVKSSIGHHENKTQQEINDDLLSFLESGILHSSDILGDTFPAVPVPQSIKNTSVLVIATPFIATHADNKDSLTENSPRIHGDSSDCVLSKKQAAVGKSELSEEDAEYYALNLFDEADRWGLTAATETANLYSTYPLQTIPACSHEHSDLEINLDADWSREELHTNAEIARLLDIFVRKLNY